MVFRKIEKINLVELFLEGLNNAFSNRSNEKIPYFEMSINKLLLPNIDLFVIEIDNEIVGGGALEKHDKYAVICHVWTSPLHQNKGIGSFLMDNLEQEAINYNMDYILLNVASVYKPALRLYNSKGYKKYSKYAYVPNSHYAIEMIKILNESSIKMIRMHYVISCLKFFLLFKKIAHRDYYIELSLKLIHSDRSNLYGRIFFK